MHGRPVTQSLSDTHTSHPNRWRVLGVLVLALLVTSIDHTIINVAMPRLVDDLGASSSQLQWIVAAFTIVIIMLSVALGWHYLVDGLIGILSVFALLWIEPRIWKWAEKIRSLWRVDGQPLPSSGKA